jgi:GrpB-like predicted nucleotidyltransferase (UPF0157 family)
VTGLRRGTVRLRYGYSTWRSQFRATAEIMRAVLSRLESVAHVGSTSVPRLLAKPIVDIAIGTSEERIELVASLIASIGYRDHGSRPEAGGRILDFLCGGLVTQHVHVVSYDGEQWQRYLLHRRHLQGSHAARLRYQSLKLSLSKLYPNNRRAYTRGKRGFLDALVCEALTTTGVARNSKGPGSHRAPLFTADELSESDQPHSLNPQT